MKDKEEIDSLKESIFSEDWETVCKAADRLGAIGGEDVFKFLVSLLDLPNSGIRNRAALALRDIEDSRAVNPLLKAINEEENKNYNGTMAYALETFSQPIKERFLFLFLPDLFSFHSPYFIFLNSSACVIFTISKRLIEKSNYKLSNTDEFTRIIKENQGIIFKVSAFYTSNEDDQKDLYQEIVIQLWKSFGQFSHHAKISTWIYRVALNTAVTQFRKVKRKVRQVPINKVVMNYTESMDTGFEERLKSLYRQIEKLNELEKGIIFLVLENKSYEEIASVTGLTLTNVATRLSRIKQKLKSQLENN